jgi:uncharacterized protein YcfJ
MRTLLGTTLAVLGLAFATQAAAEVTFYEHDGFQGRSFTTQRRVADFKRYGFNDRASSVVVTSDRWEVCEDVRFGGRCVVLRPGQYPSLRAMGLNDRLSSVRAVSRDARVRDDHFAPAPVVDHDYRRRHNERLYQARVVAVHAVVGPPEQRCWIEREQVVQDRSDANVPGAIFGAVIGGILGHQIGRGDDRNLATVGGVVAGAAVGSSIGHDDREGRVVSRNVKRCANVPSHAQPDYWDVVYTFRGQQFSMQTTSPPGATVTVNRDGEPRV